jgi:hypothetical protein
VIELSVPNNVEPAPADAPDNVGPAPADEDAIDQLPAADLVTEEKLTEIGEFTRAEIIAKVDASDHALNEVKNFDDPETFTIPSDADYQMTGFGYGSPNHPIIKAYRERNKRIEKDDDEGSANVNVITAIALPSIFFNIEPNGDEVEPAHAEPAANPVDAVGEDNNLPRGDEDS